MKEEAFRIDLKTILEKQNETDHLSGDPLYLEFFKYIYYLFVCDKSVHGGISRSIAEPTPVPPKE